MKRNLVAFFLAFVSCFFLASCHCYLVHKDLNYGCFKKAYPPEKLRKNSVLLPGCSGNVFQTEQGPIIWTAYHCVESYLQEDGSFVPVPFLTWDHEEGEAEVLAYEQCSDIALLVIRTEHVWPQEQLHWSLEGLSAGEDVWFVGNSCAERGQGTVTSGIFSFQDRWCREGLTLDQASCPTFPGASGGMICLQHDGKMIGFVRGGVGETFTTFVPARRVHQFCTERGLSWAFVQ